MNEEWFLYANGEKSGPLSFIELQTKLQQVDRSKGDTLVWAASTVEWVDPSKVPGLLSDETPAISGTAPVLNPPVGNPASTDTSSLNPYAAPQSTAGDSPILTSGNHSLAPGTAIEVGWKRCVNDAGNVILVSLVYFAISVGCAFPAGVVAKMAETDNSLHTLNLGLQIVQNIVSVFLGIGFSLFSIKLIQARGEAKVGDLFAGAPFFFPVVGAFLLIWLLMLVAAIPAGILLAAAGKEVGIVAFGIWGVFLIYMMFRLAWSQIVIVDQRVGPITALQTSWRMTRGNVFNIFIVWLAVAGISIAGVLALCVGLLWAMPVAMTTWVAAYYMMAKGQSSLGTWS